MGSREYDAHWTLKQFHVYFDTGGGSKVDDEIVWIHDKAVQPADPEKKSATFLGWYADSAKTTEYDFDQEVTSDRTIYAKWKEGVPKSGDTRSLLLWIILTCGSLTFIGYEVRKMERGYTIKQ